MNLTFGNKKCEKDSKKTLPLTVKVIKDDNN